MTPEELERLELLRQLIASGGGTNLAGQTATDPTYSSGQAYAQQIAGGVIPNSQVIAPGVSYSPEQAGGYTQADLDMIAAGPAPVMPIAPTTGDVATIDDQMEFAPVGTTEPTRFSIGDTLFPNVDYLQGLDFSGIPGLGNIDVDAIIKEYQDRQDAGEPEPFESFFTEPSQVPVMPSFPIQQPMNFTGLPQMPFMPESIAPIPVMPRIPQIAYIPPASSFIQPRVEEIVSPIRSGSPRNFQQPGLFNLV